MAYADDITRLYKQYFGRAPDAAGLAYWTDMLQKGIPLATMEATLKSSPEYANLTGASGGTPAAIAAPVNPSPAPVKQPTSYDPTYVDSAGKAFYTDPWQMQHEGIDMGNGQTFFANPANERSGTASLDYGFATQPGQTVANITSPGGGAADYDWLTKNVKQGVTYNGQQGFSVANDMVGGLGGAMTQTGRDNGKYAEKSKGIGGLLSVLAIAAAIYTGGAAAGLWGGSAGASSAAATIGASVGDVSLAAGTAAATAAETSGLAGMMASAEAALSGGATLSSVASALTAAGVAADAIPEIIVTASSTAGSALTLGQVTAGIAAGATLASVAGVTPMNATEPDLTTHSPIDGSGVGATVTTAGGLSGVLGGTNLAGTGADTLGTAAGGTTIGTTLANLATPKNILDAVSGVTGVLNANKTADQQRADAASALQADPYHDYIKDSVVPFMQGQQSLSTNLQKDASGTASQLSDLFKTNPLGGDYAKYQSRLQDSYDNPLGVYNSPEMQALSSVFNNQIERRDAAAGRNSQYGARAVEEQNNFLTNTLPTYRTGLNNDASTAGNLQSNVYGTNVSGLNSLYSNQSTNATNAARNAIPGSSGTAGVAGSTAATTAATNTSSSSLLPIFDAVGKIIGYKP